MVDASASVGNIHDAQSTYIKEFATLLSGDFNKPVANQWGSPISQHYQTRMGLVTFFGPCITCANTCSNPLASTHVEQIFSLRSPGPNAADLRAIHGAIDSRRGATGLTCIRCGLQYVRDRVTVRSTALPTIVLLSDGRQTTCGDASTAVAVATELKNKGYKIVVVTHDDSDMGVLKQIASEPDLVFVRPTGSTPNGALADISSALTQTCPEVLQVCKLSKYCGDPMRIVVHGHGFGGHTGVGLPWPTAQVCANGEWSTRACTPEHHPQLTVAPGVALCERERRCAARSAPTMPSSPSSTTALSSAKPKR